MAQHVITIPYKPREAFLPFHRRKQRFAALVAHRRAGKTVAAVNDTLRRACTDAARIRKQYGVDPKYAFIGPLRGQMKDVAWAYLKHYSRDVQVKPPNESELKVTVVGNAVIGIYGADNPDALRGLGLDGAYLDEFGDMKPGTWSKVIRPALSDRAGWAVIGGTPKGHNEFYDLYSRAESDQDWYRTMLKASETLILSASELAAARKELSEDEYLQEYECSFEAAILGAYYGREMRELTDRGGIRDVPHDDAVPVCTAWDLGRNDDTAIWWYQVIRGEVHVLDYFAVSGANIEDLADQIAQRPYPYFKHWLPHDARAKTLASGGKSVIEQLAKYLGISTLAIVPDIGVQDGIQAVRRMLPRVWFDRRCMDGVEALRQYQREYDQDKKAFRLTPRHDWTSHPADAFRMLAVAEREHEVSTKPAKPRFPLDLSLNELWEDHKREQMQERRI